MGSFNLSGVFLANFSQFSRLIANFSETHELLAYIFFSWYPCRCYYCYWLVSTIFDILAVAGLSSAVDVCDVPIVSAVVA